VPGGSWGKILRVDLSKSTIKEETIPEEWLNMFVGGRGLAVRYLIEEVPKGADPLGPDNVLIFMTGLLTGVASPTASKHSVVAKSPLTGIFGHSIAGGRWATKLKKTGFDGIIFQGVSPKPVYLVIDEGAAELRDAGHLWGKNTFETNAAIQEELEKGFGVTSIGTAGENLVKYAAIVDNDERVAGRCGMGAVMGSKLLKAIAVKGTKMIPIANKEAFKESAKRHYQSINENFITTLQHAYGTTTAVETMNVLGYLPHKNWQTGYMENARKVGGVIMRENNRVGEDTCVACSVRCGSVVEVKPREFTTGFRGRGPEYETLGVWGSMCDLEDIDAVLTANHLCNDYGLDTMSCGSSIAFAMECYEKGILTKAETDGLDLKFGNIEAALSLIPKIARREGFGDFLAEGTRIMSQKLGRGTERFAIHVKGLELPMYEVRGAKIVGMSFAVGSRGGCHNMGGVQLPAIAEIKSLMVKHSHFPEPLEGKPEHAHDLKDHENAYTVVDCVGYCKFVAGVTLGYKETLEAVSSILGHEFTYEDYMKLGERVWNIERVFNVREGITRADDTLPARLLEEPLTTGQGKGHVAKIDNLIDPYYEVRGWDENGKPTPEKLKELGLEDIIKHLN